MYKHSKTDASEISRSEREASWFRSTTVLPLKDELHVATNRLHNVKWAYRIKLSLNSNYMATGGRPGSARKLPAA